MSRIIEDDDGCHIIRVVERDEAKRAPFTDVQPEIKKALHERRRSRAEEENTSKAPRKDARLDRLRRVGHGRRSDAVVRVSSARHASCTSAIDALGATRSKTARLTLPFAKYFSSQRLHPRRGISPAAHARAAPPPAANCAAPLQR